LNTLIEGIITGDSRFIQKSTTGTEFTVLPTNKFLLPFDNSAVIQNGTVSPKDAELIENPLSWEITGNSIPKSSLIQLDVLSNNYWERPIYFVTGANEGAMNMEDYFQLEGLAYRLVPINTPSIDNFFEPGRVNTEKLYDNLMNKFSWGRMNEDDVYLDYYNLRTFSVIKFRKTFVRLAEALTNEGKPDLAEKVLDRCMELAPHHKVPYDYFISGITLPGKEDAMVRHTGIIEAYFKCGAIEKANKLIQEYSSILQQDMVYYNSLEERFRRRFHNEAIQSQNIYQEMLDLAELYGEEGQ
jgi:tetratricopeptide (TPR) repeat protein